MIHQREAHDIRRCGNRPACGNGGAAGCFRQCAMVNQGLQRWQRIGVTAACAYCAHGCTVALILLRLAFGLTEFEDQSVRLSRALLERSWIAASALYGT